MADDQPLTSAELLSLANGKRAVAFAMQDDRLHCREAWQAAGSAVEFALKAVIIRRRRLNAWPSRDVSPELYTHDLRILMMHAGVEPADIPSRLRGRLKAALDWERHHDYRPGKMPRRVARDMVTAVFGVGGVCEWLSSL